MSSFKVCKAKTFSSGSVSDRKPRTPDAEVKPGMVDMSMWSVGGFGICEILGKEWIDMTGRGGGLEVEEVRSWKFDVDVDVYVNSFAQAARHRSSRTLWSERAWMRGPL